MKLESVELKGFKSFKDRINLQFNMPICAIVGPNGSGKSNISDGIRWVLGEQSAKSLRGNKMEDVIFSGTEKTAPLNFASVSMSFDNKDKWIPIDYENVVVSRRVFRSGESEYFINKKSCRLKDIRELFMDTGIGKEGYSIIGQGRIDEILSTRGEDRRYIFEEASGISKYKYKKEEALRKLDKTVSNLGRIEDVVLQKQENRDYLEKQANKATIGLKLSNEIKHLDLYYFLQDVQIIKNKYDEILKQNKSIKDEIDEYKNIILKEDPLLKNEDEYLKKLQIEIKDDKKEESTLNAKLQDCKLKLSLSKERVINDKNEIESLKREKSYFIQRLKSNEEKLESLNENEKDLKAKIKISQSKLENVENKLQDLSSKLKVSSSKVESKESEIATTKENLNKIQIEKLTRERIEENRREDISKLLQDKTRLEKEIAELKRDFKNLNNIQSKIQQDFSLKQESLQTLEKENTKYKNEYQILKDKNNSLISEYSSKKKEMTFYINVRDNYEGYNRQVSTFFNRIKKTRLKDKCIGTLADLIEVKDKYLLAINNSLGGSLQNVVVENEYDAKELIEFLKIEKIGRLTFLPLNKINKANINIKFDDSRILAIASDLVKCDKKYKGLINHFLNKTLVVSTLEDAIDISKKYKSYRVVTLNGEIFNSWGSIVGGYSGKSANTGILNRNNKILELENELINIESSRTKYLKQIDEYELKIQKHSKEIDNINSDLLSNSKEKQLYQEKIQKNSNNLEVKESLLNEILIKFNSYENLEGKEVSTDNPDELQVNLNNLSLELQKLKKELESDRSDYNKFEIEKIDVLSKCESLERDLNILLNNSTGIKNEVEDLIHRLSINEQTESEVILNLKEKDKEIVELEKDIVNFEIAKDDIFKKLERKESEFDNRQKSYFEKKDQIADYKNIIVKLEYSMNLNLEKLDNLKSNIDRIRQNSIEEYTVYIDKFTLFEDCIDPSRKKLKSLKRELKELGFFSADTIEEFKIVDNDLNFLLLQKDDLLKSKNDIEKIIKNLDKEMKEMFIKSFKDINDKFQKIFKILFDGGRAELKLEGSNPLESSVEIVAEPPGKKLQSLSLLSGGEKALSAVALLFAIFETRPSPFCILDEIDAALDEANITRYTNYLKSLTNKTQFIMISHRKTTMEIADVLYGVSMEEEGISKVVSLKLK